MPRSPGPVLTPNIRPDFSGLSVGSYSTAAPNSDFGISLCHQACNFAAQDGDGGSGQREQGLWRGLD